MSDWRQELDSLLGTRTRTTRAELESARFSDFLARVVLSAFKELGDALAAHGRETLIRESPASATMTVRDGDVDEISVRVLMRSLPNNLIPYAEVRLRKRHRVVRTETLFRDSDKAAGLDDITSEEIIRSVLKHYRSAVEPGG